MATFLNNTQQTQKQYNCCDTKPDVRSTEQQETERIAPSNNRVGPDDKNDVSMDIMGRFMKMRSKKRV